MCVMRLFLIFCLFSCSLSKSLVSIRKASLDKNFIISIKEAAEQINKASIKPVDPKENSYIQAINENINSVVETLDYQASFENGKNIYMSIVDILKHQEDADQLLAYIFKGIFLLNSTSELRWQKLLMEELIIANNCSLNNILHLLLELDFQKTALVFCEMGLQNLEEALLSLNEDGLSPLALSIVKHRWMFFSYFTKLQQDYTSIADKKDAMIKLRNIHKCSVDKWGNNILMAAVIGGWNDAIVELLPTTDRSEDDLVCMSYKNKEGSNVLYEMIKHNTTPYLIVRVIKRYSDLEDNIPMYLAAYKRDKKLVGLLHAAGFPSSSTKLEKTKAIAKTVLKIVSYASGIAIDKFLTGSMALGNPVVRSIETAEKAIDDWQSKKGKEGAGDEEYGPISKILNARFIEETIQNYNWLPHVILLHGHEGYIPDKVKGRIKLFVDSLTKQIPTKEEFAAYDAQLTEIQQNMLSSIFNSLEFATNIKSVIQAPSESLRRLLNVEIASIKIYIDNLSKEADNFLRILEGVKVNLARVKNY